MRPLPGAVLLLGLAGCGAPPAAAPPQDAEAAYLQRAKADLGLHFLSWEDLGIWTPSRNLAHADLKALTELLASPEVPRDRAAVVMDPAWSASGSGVPMSDIQKLLKDQGFRHVFFHRGGDFDTPRIPDPDERPASRRR